MADIIFYYVFPVVFIVAVVWNVVYEVKSGECYKKYRGKGKER